MPELERTEPLGPRAFPELLPCGPSDLPASVPAGLVSKLGPLCSIPRERPASLENIASSRKPSLMELGPHANGYDFSF